MYTSTSTGSGTRHSSTSGHETIATLSANVGTLVRDEVGKVVGMVVGGTVGA